MRLMPALALALAMLSAATPGAYREGPAPAMTGGFGEATCAKCHFDNAVNDRGGSARIDGVPDTYVPGRAYPLTVTLDRSGMTRGGFELSARFAPGSSLAGRQAGALRVGDDRTQIVAEPNSAVRYIQHTKTGSASPAAGRNRWTFTWIAPPAGTGAAVQFNLAANAANDDASALGDFVYVLSKRSGVGRGRLPAPGQR
jgi:hypothetical protein